MSEEKERPHAAPLWIILFASLVFLALCGLLWVVGFRVELVAALLWLRAVLLLFFQTMTFVQLLGFLEELVEVKLSDDVLLRDEIRSGLASMCECQAVSAYSTCLWHTRLTSLKVQDTALPLLSTIGRLIISRPPWKSTSEGSCLARGEVLTLYLFRESSWDSQYLCSESLSKSV